MGFKDDVDKIFPTASRPRSCLMEVYKLLTSSVTSRLLSGIDLIVCKISKKWPVSLKKERVFFIKGVSIFSRCTARGEKIDC